VVVDDNGTPGNTADDFLPNFSGGDSNSNNQLDLGETWTYTATRPVIAGQFTTTGSASAQDIINQVINSTDQTNYFGAVNANFNGDAVVDAADYVMWRKNSATSSGATRSEGDADGNGAVNEDDYFVWRSQFDTTPAGASALGEADDGADPLGADPFDGQPVAVAPVTDHLEAAAFANVESRGILSNSTNTHVRSSIIHSSDPFTSALSDHTLGASRRLKEATRASLGSDNSDDDWSLMIAALAEGRVAGKKSYGETEAAQTDGSTSEGECDADADTSLATDVALRTLRRYLD
jgi:hypothetical protein